MKKKIGLQSVFTQFFLRRAAITSRIYADLSPLQQRSAARGHQLGKSLVRQHSPVVARPETTPVITVDSQNITRLVVTASPACVQSSRNDTSICLFPCPSSSVSFALLLSLPVRLMLSNTTLVMGRLQIQKYGGVNICNFIHRVVAKK